MGGMRRRLPWLALACVLAACGKDDPEFVLHFRDLPEDTTVLDMFGSRPGTARLYYMEASSNVDRSVRLQARFDRSPPEGMRVRMLRGELLPRGSAKPILQVQLPSGLGSIEGTILIYSDELPGWQRRYEFTGTVEDRPLEGKYLKVEPPGMDLGDLRPGERKEFGFSLQGIGTEAVTIHGITARAEEHIRLVHAEAGILAPAGTQRVTGFFSAPKAAGPFQTMIDVRTNADNFKDRVTVLLVVLRSDGSLKKAYVMNPSGAPFLDDEAREAVENAARIAERDGINENDRAKVPPVDLLITKPIDMNDAVNQISELLMFGGRLP